MSKQAFSYAVLLLCLFGCKQSEDGSTLTSAEEADVEQNNGTSYGYQTTTSNTAVVESTSSVSSQPYAESSQAYAGCDADYSQVSTWGLNDTCVASASDEAGVEDNTAADLGSNMSGDESAASARSWCRYGPGVFGGVYFKSRHGSKQQCLDAKTTNDYCDPC